MLLIQRILFPLLQQFYQDTLNYLVSDTTKAGGIKFWPRRRLLEIGHISISRLQLSVRPSPDSDTDVTTALAKSTYFRKVGMDIMLLVVVYQCGHWTASEVEATVPPFDIVR